MILLVLCLYRVIMSSTASLNKARIRDEMRYRRTALSNEQVAESSERVAERLWSIPVVNSAELLTAYHAIAGEISLEVLTNGKHWQRFTFPRVKGENLEFVARFTGQPFVAGPFGIPEPTQGQVIAAGDHTVLLVPVVAFDENCNRIGQGGGYYDRVLADVVTPGGIVASDEKTVSSDQEDVFISGETSVPDNDVSVLRSLRRPVVIGVAYEFQRVADVPVDPWDVPLDAIVTDSRLLVAHTTVA